MAAADQTPAAGGDVKVVMHDTFVLKGTNNAELAEILKGA